jgi:probable HAF family extracellular repeat protein
MDKLWHRRPAITKLIIITPALALLVIGASALAQPRYSVAELSNVGGLSLFPQAINNEGQLGGYAFFPGYSDAHAFFYNGSHVTDLGTLGGTYSAIANMNDSGQLVGGSYLTPGDTTSHGFLYSGGTMHDLGTLPGGAWSAASGINQSGQVVGESATPTGFHAFLYSQGQMTDLGTFGGPYSGALAINNRGQIVGNASTTGNAASYAFLYSNGSMHSLGTFGFGSIATDINDNGQIVGACTMSDSIEHAFYYSDGVMRDLGALPDEYTRAMAINNRGDAVGFSSRAGQNHSFIYTDGTKYDLESLLAPGSAGWTFQYVYDINDSGQIVGLGVNPLTHRQGGVVLTPVPEPSAGSFFALGLFSLLLRKKMSLSDPNTVRKKVCQSSGKDDHAVSVR